ncbi:Serine phosphatase RsbU, regulator of sigma subunit [Catalinimonas alkaloidigena]|uniref:Serine phosphatase RsbU, regulator of sigma subunit n=1 Tax=Catalinimonas alkaloidigena TaxID=1075417 RepID=A0A1G9K7L5_9BACT|nr:response regulator [Catalinimonas alkaloidigena]SDL45728.1 Serine phosphatase RsbU, regulator of sigma subunit [Catalinimonas alkaloidigena]
MTEETLTILIIDDNEEDVLIFRRYLTYATILGRTVRLVRAATGAEGMDLHDEHNPDCTFLDYRLPDMTGEELLKILMQRKKHNACFVMLTSSGNESVAASVMKHGALDYLNKAWISEEQLIKTVESALQRYQLQQELERQRNRLQKSNKKLRQQQKEMERLLTLLEQDNLRKTQELQAARQLQLSMLPQQSPRLDFLDIAMHMNTCDEVGGDYYDFKIDADGQLYLAVGDATGHGFRAGVVVATVKSYFHSLAGRIPSVELMKAISQGIKNLQTRGMYMGLRLVQIGPTRFVSTASGMPPLLYYQAAAQRVHIIEQRGLFLGSGLSHDIPSQRFSWEKGDVLLALTDGMIELFNADREQLSLERIIERFQQSVHHSAAQIIEHIVALGRSWSQGLPNEDDITLVVVRSA